MSVAENNDVLPPLPTEDSGDGECVQQKRLDELESPNNNNHTSANSSLKNERVASNLLKMLSHDSILDGLELPPSEHLMEDPDYEEDHPTGYRRKIVSTESVTEGSFIHSHSDLSDDDDSCLQFPSERQFELEFKLHEAEQKVEQLNLQLKGKSMQLEQVQVALISYEEEIMQLRQHMANGSDGDEESAKKLPPTSVPDPIGAVSLETAEQLSSKIIMLQERVEELEEIMVHTKLDNAQLKETTDFLKAKLRQYAKKERAEKKAAAAKESSVKNLFGRSK